MLKRARLLCYLVLCVSWAVLSVVLGALSVRFVGWADWVDCRCFLSFVFLGVARSLELSPCNTTSIILAGCDGCECKYCVASLLMTECMRVHSCIHASCV